MAEKRSAQLLEEYAAQNATDAGGVDELRKIDDPDTLFSLLATRVTSPTAMFATPGDRYGTKFDVGEVTRSGPMVELGKRIFFRCSDALHDFLCKANSDDKQLQQSLIKALVGKEVGSVGIIAGGLVVLFGMAPAAAAVVAAILVQVVVAPTVNVLCEEWDASIAHSLASKKS
jgi:hypothetical protein